MGFRSTFVTDSYDIKWPRWFINKWKDVIWFKCSKELTKISHLDVDGKTGDGTAL